jgi:putative oxidoreductase
MDEGTMFKAFFSAALKQGWRLVVLAGITGNVVPPTVIAYLIAAIDLFGGLMLLVGFKLRWVAWVLFVFIVLTLFFAHPFWTMEGPARVANQGNFLKNLALMGAMLLVAFGNPGRCSLDGRISAR